MIQTVRRRKAEGKGEKMSIALRSLVPMLHVVSVPRSIAFYQKLGFAVGHSFAPTEGADPTWAFLEGDGAGLMVMASEGAVEAGGPGVLFYIYCDDVSAKHGELKKAGLPVGPIDHPFHAPYGEFHVLDPDGFELMITHT